MKTAALLPLAGARGTAANSAVTVGLIGSGGRGTFDAGLLVNIENARLVALCDIFDDRIERVKKAVPLKDPKVYKDYRELRRHRVAVARRHTDARRFSEHPPEGAALNVARPL